MTRTLRGLLVTSAALCALASPVFSQNIPYTPGSGGTLGAVTCGTSVSCPKNAQIDSAGNDATDTTFHGLRNVGTFSNPSLNSVLTLGASAAYGIGTALCASSCTPSSMYITLANGNMSITGGQIRINDTLATSWAVNSQIGVDLFSAAPTLANGDGGAYKFSGTANYLGSLICTNNLGVETDGEAFKCNVVGSTLDVALGSAGAKLYATFYTPTGSGTPTAGSTLNLTLTGKN